MLSSAFTTQGANPQQGSFPMSQGAGTPAARALNGFQPSAQPIPLVPSSSPIKSHTIQHPDGTKIVQTYHNPGEQKKTSGMLNTPIQAPQQSSIPEVKTIDKLHHVPYQKEDGGYGFIDAQGNTH